MEGVYSPGVYITTLSSLMPTSLSKGRAMPVAQVRRTLAIKSRALACVATEPLKLYKPLPPKVRRILHADAARELSVQECWIFGSGRWGLWGSVVNLQS